MIPKGRRGRPAKQAKHTLPPPHVPARVSPERRDFTDAKKAMVFEIISKGGTPMDAAAIVNVSPRMISYMAAKDIDFAIKLRAAATACKMHHIERIYDGEKQWQSSAWFLERRYSREFAVGAGATEAERTIYVRRVVRNKPIRNHTEVPIDEVINAGELQLPENPDADTDDGTTQLEQLDESEGGDDAQG